MKIEENIIEAIKKVAGEKKVHLETPERMEHGDYSSNIAMVMFSNSQFPPEPSGSGQAVSNFQFKPESPRELAEVIKDKLNEDEKLSELVDKIEVEGPGFINFWIKTSVLSNKLLEALKRGDDYGKNDILNDKKIMVEFAHPNTHKQFHIGHMRNISIGEAIARLLEFLGAEVIRTNYQGDVGLHVAKALWGVKNLKMPDDDARVEEKVKFLGEAYAKGATAYTEDEKAKAEIVDINKKIYTKDDEIEDIWKKTRKWSLEYFDEIYKRVGTRFDRLFFESEVHEPGKKIAKKALDKGILEKSQGAVVFNGEKYRLDTRVFLTKEGIPTYEAKELGLAQLEFSEFGEIDKALHVVAPEQSSFFEVTFKVEELLDPEKYKSKQKHLKYGFVQLKKGKMSSRTGNVVTGTWLMDEAKSRAKELIKEGYSKEEMDGISEKVGVGAVKYSMLLPAREKNITFDMGESVALEGNSGPYLQYTYARIKSVIEKSKEDKTKKKPRKVKKHGVKQKVVIKAKEPVKKASPAEPEYNKEEMALLRSFIQFPKVVQSAAENYAPNLICNYLYDLAQKYNTFYNKHRILNAKNDKEGAKVEKSKSAFRLLLTGATGQILKNGLYLLGIEAPEKM